MTSLKNLDTDLRDEAPQAKLPSGLTIRNLRNSRVPTQRQPPRGPPDLEQKTPSPRDEVVTCEGRKIFSQVWTLKIIKEFVYRLGEESGVKVYRFANGGNHLHLLVLPNSREAFNAYVRALSGLIARVTLGAERGKAMRLKFWDARPFTRIIEWGREFKTVCGYVLQNTLEAIGFIPYQPRKSRARKAPS